MSSRFGPTYGAGRSERAAMALIYAPDEFSSRRGGAGCG